MTHRSDASILYFFAAFASGGVLTLMILFNGTLAAYGSAFFSSWVPHLTGTFAALLFLLVMRQKRVVGAGRAPWWAYLGGIAGGVTVMLSSTTVNTPLALSGTIALGLLGQIMFGLVADIYGMLGLPKRRPSAHDIISLLLVLVGSLIIVLYGRG